MENTNAVDVEYLVRKGSNAGYRLFSLIVPPVYTAFVLTRYGRGAFSINGLLRTTWIGGLGGTIGGGGFAYARYGFSNSESVRLKRTQTSYDTNRIRAEDHSTIGGILFAVLTPAIFWKRARMANLILGGAGLGSSFGLLTHYTRSLSGDLPPKAVTPTSVE